MGGCVDVWDVHVFTGVEIDGRVDEGSDEADVIVCSRPLCVRMDVCTILCSVGFEFAGGRMASLNGYNFHTYLRSGNVGAAVPLIPCKRVGAIGAALVLMESMQSVKAGYMSPSNKKN